MKKLLFTACDMNMGGIEASLATLLNYLVERNHDITLVLERKQGILLKSLDDKIKIIEYKPSNSKIIFIRKVVNAIKRTNFIIKHKNKYDFSASFATYSKMGSFVARVASKNNALWGHADYLELYKNEIEKMKKFFEELHYNEFSKIVFVAKSACKSFIKVFPKMQDRVMYCNNMRDYENILKLSNEKVEYEKTKYTFVNVSRHDELQKKLTRIIEASKLLKEDRQEFEVVFVGNGEDTTKYKKMVEEYNLQDTIKFVGEKKNPYPYMKLADSIILSSDYEGYPLVFTEAMLLNKPIITTDVADALEDIEGKFGKVVKKDVKEIYQAMKEFIENGYEIKEKFNAEEYNKNIVEKLEKIF